MNNNMGMKPNERPDMFKTSVDKNNLPSNYIYGVDTNDRREVEKAYKRLKRKHIMLTFLSLILVVALSFLAYNAIQVNVYNKKPIFSLKKKIEGGYIYTGIGYKVMICDNGDVFKFNLDRQTCDGVEYENNMRGLMLKNLRLYLRNNKYIDESNLKTFEFEEVTFDEYNDQEGVDYLVDLHVECKDGSSSCMKIFKETPDQSRVKLYIVMDRANYVVDVKSFKNTGEYYKLLKEEYTEKVKKYMIDNNMIDEENLRWFKVELFGNRGRYRFEDVMYADSYLISIDYFCHDNSNTCVTRFDNSAEYSNLSFDASMFLDDNYDVANLRSLQVLQ